jgi:hypothetical protein
MPINLTATVRGVTNLERYLKVQRENQKRAMETAIRVEGFRLRKELQSQIRAGAVGGRSLDPLTVIARRYFRTKKGPLLALAGRVAYQVSRQPFEMRVGWTGPKLSKSWKSIAKKQQEGFESPVSYGTRMFIIRRGAALAKGRSAAKGDSKYFFLRSDTKRFQTPARPIMEPFWGQQQGKVVANIRLNFFRKLKGERI